ncbi:MAG: 2-vinyl bacteriochlorophyllide hydratase [Anaerolineae bacterium]|nr:2-vinyl bacteriochlorophyllide hydratase [Anaerolineae bacterium]
MDTTYTQEQLDRRNRSKWTLVQAILAPLQFLTFLISLGLIIRYLMTGDGYTLATLSVLVKIGMLWLITFTGMIWEKEVYGQWFMAPQFFWEDALNAVALFMHNLYFVALLLGVDHAGLMTLMLVAYISYLVNFAQFFVKGLQARKARLARTDVQAA